MIGIIIAMDKELFPYLSGNSYVKKEIGGKEFFEFNINGKEAVAVKSGIGKVNSAYATTLLINNYNPEFIISTGISGGLGRKNVLDIVVAEKCVQYDVDTSALGDEIGFVSTVNKTYFDADKEKTELFAEKIGAAKVVFACGDRFVADKNLSDYIVKLFNASACDMESGAIAQIAYITNTPFVAIRCISDSADGNAAISYEKLTEIASQKLYEAVKASL